MLDHRREDDLLALLVRSCTEALNVRVTAESDFLALGGDSLSAVLIAQKVCEQYSDDGLETVLLEVLFDAPDLRAVAETLTRHMSFSR